MSDGIFNADLDQYLRAAGIDGPPPAITSDPLIAGLTPTEQLLRMLGLAANADDPADIADSVALQTERDSGASESARAFAAEDERAGADLNSTAAQIPALIAGIAGAVAGALGGVLQPLGQIPQALGQIPQALGQLPQSVAQISGFGMGGDGERAEPDLAFDDAFDEFGDTGRFGDTWTGDGGDGGASAAGGVGAGGGPGGVPGTAATGVLGPPPVPSAGTAPASAPALRISPPGIGAAGSPAAAGMAGLPLIPPGAMHPAAAGDKDAKTETKRVSVPTVRNGAPVQGRLVPPPAAPTVVTRVEGKPVATKRVVAPALE
jgi:hypothetical protein